TDEIYTEFSHGNLDPTAIRDYIGNAMHTWSHKPSHVLLIGDASYDFRGLITATQQKQFVPIYETDDRDNYDHLASSSFDDYYVRVIGADGDELVDLAIGRFPIETADQGKVIMAKIRRYENAANYGVWRQTIGLVTDDDFPLGDGGGFTGQSERLWTVDVPGWMETKKIYLGNYPTDYSSSNKKPGAAEDLAQTFERGAVMLNWIGHGNPDVWAHEHILVKDDFIPRLTNDSTLTYVSAATCNFGYLDEPTHISGAEEFLLHPNGGAIAVMSTTRAVLISNAQDFMYDHYAAVFARDKATHRYGTLGQILATTKNTLGYGSEREKFFLLGDPALHLNLPHDSVSITRINSRPVDGDSANPKLTTIAALSLVTVEGQVLDNTGVLQSGFNGTAIVDLFDADRKVIVNSGETSMPVIYYGGRLFRGPAQVVNGKFSVSFRVPKDIAYDSTPGRMFVYAYNDKTDAAGMTNRIRVFGSDTTTVTDRGGPDIKIYLDDRSFRGGDIVTPKPLLMLDLADSSGINSSGAGIGHRIEAWIDNNPKSIDLTDSYQTLPTDYRQGTAQRRLFDLEPGEHHVRVRAWDIYNNSSEATSYFRISEADEKTLHVEDVVNFPNPMTKETDFLFRHNQSRPLDAEVSIFTLTGRKVRLLQANGVTDRFVRIHWDGTDADGAPLANGVYLYRLRVKLGATVGEGATAEQVFETIEKV
ncbi:MAG: type IX secretion system sortase PorU, partial [Candidatus Kapaibacterium sp.]